jgi:prophage regulatory protein
MRAVEIRDLYGATRSLHSVRPTGWPSGEIGIALIRSLKVMLTRPLGEGIHMVPIVPVKAESGTMSKAKVSKLTSELAKFTVARSLKMPHRGSSVNKGENTMDGFIGFNQVRELIGVGRTTLYRMIDDGRIPKPGNLAGGYGTKVVWRQSVINEWMDTVAPSAASSD